MELSQEVAARFAQAALGHVAREYPHKLDHVMDGDVDVQPPRELHPVFFGSFDWHSCVHGWWTLLTLRRLFPDMAESARITDLAESTFTAEKLADELAYARRPSSRAFERPYGWGWLLYLHHEAARHNAPWAARIEPLARHFAQSFKQYLDVLTYPVFVGTHYNTAFALTLARQWANKRDPELRDAIDAWSTRAFASRTDYRGWEPGGDEFLSPVLSAALLLRHTLPHAQFAPWFAALVLDNGWLATLDPASVSDRSDGKIAHLDGLNLSRAWALREIVPTLSHAEDRALLQQKAAAHLEAALPHVTGDYMGEHWLASFALLALLASE